MALDNEITATMDEVTGHAAEQEPRLADLPDDVLTRSTGALNDDRARGGSGTPMPHLRRVEPASGKEAGELLHAVRRFHRGDPPPDGRLAAPNDEYLPALLYPFRDPAALRSDYPLFLYPDQLLSDDQLCIPLSDLMEQTVEGFADTPDTARILRDNLDRLELRVRERIPESGAPVDTTEILQRAGEHVVNELKLSDDNAEQLRNDLERLREALPQGGRLVRLGSDTPLHLFVHVALHHARARRAELRRRVSTLKKKLHDVLMIDLGKEPEGRRSDVLMSMVGDEGAAHIDPDALGKLLGPARGVQPMPIERRERIQGVVEVLEKFLAQKDRGLVKIVHTQGAPPECRIDDIDWHGVTDGTVCHEAAAIFDRTAFSYAKLFGAIRTAELELRDAYESPRHDELIQAFDWEAFSREELLAMPPIIAIETGEDLAGEGMLCISRVQLSGRPVSVVVMVQPALNPGVPPDHDQLMGWRFEMAYRGISHRESLVNQTSAARPEHLLGGYQRSLNSTRPSMHVIASGLTADGEVPPIGTWLHFGAALEGRAHPFFHFDPGRGSSWAKRFDFSGNPQPEEDWPAYDLTCLDPDGTEKTLNFAFTFADFVLLEPRYREHFRIIPDALDADELVTVKQYFEMTIREALERIPYLWATDGEGQLHRVAISRRLAFACRDRLGFWQTLQELAGIRNEYVQEALQRERQRLESEYESKRKQLEEAHAAELDEVRRNAASEAMQRLAQALLDADLSALPTGGATGAPPPPTTETPTSEAKSAGREETTGQPQVAEPEPVEAEDEDEGPQEPWIDSILCTSCNDCININSRMFVYNGAKQAMIGDPSAGTYRQLVEAAEKCPSRCIHPGTPLDPDEPGLDELKERAKKFA